MPLEGFNVMVHGMFLSVYVSVRQGEPGNYTHIIPLPKHVFYTALPIWHSFQIFYTLEVMMVIMMLMAS